MILVTGATGGHGSTGRYLAQALAKAGQPVRALARRDDERAGRLRSAGIEVAVGDLTDRRTLLAALEGVDAAYFTWPVAKGVVEAAASFASAGRQTGLKRLVVMSMGAASAESPSALGRAQWLADEVLQWAGFSTLVLRIAAFFFENLELLHRAELPAGVLHNSFGPTKVPWLAAEDAAALAAAALLYPERFERQQVVYPSGSHAHSHAELAQLLSARLGRPVQHQTVTPEEWQQRLAGLKDPRVSAEMAAHISVLGAAMSKPRPLNPLFDALTLSRPRSFAEWLDAGGLQLPG